jgi:MSHA biogenesis protein MshN
MSVINKMLRDLDQRQSPSTAPAADPVRRHTVSVEASQPPQGAVPTRGRWGLWLALMALAAFAAAGYWWQWMGGEATVRGDAPVSLRLKDDDVLNLQVALQEPIPAAPPATVAASEVVVDVTPLPVSASSAPIDPVVVVATPPTAAAVTPPSAPVAVVVPANATGTAVENSRPQPAASPASVVPRAAAVASVPAASSVSPVRPVVPATGSPAPLPVTGVAQRQQQAARDALGQAQALWNSGSQDSAVTALQAAVAVAERQDSAGLLVPLVRELARMELAQGHHGAVLELLTRLEPQLADQPDLWAVRANVAQRLGRHQDSLLAYGVALQSRPTESRWLLGMAVSLAAMGQTTQASAMVDKARAAGPISPDVLQYLRQQGVPLSERQ